MKTIVLVLALAVSTASGSHQVDKEGLHGDHLSDVVVYSATPAGIMSAVAAARHGLRVVLLEQSPHVGGMCTNGLGKTDTGNASVIGGLAKEFFVRNGAFYNSTRAVFDLEPHVAEEIFLTMLKEAGVSVQFNKVLASVAKDSARQTIQSLRTSDGERYSAAYFVDASYEGDLLALAGVSFAVGRDANTTYNESLAGQLVYSPKNQFTTRVDPFEADGHTTLPLMRLCGSRTPGRPGSGDDLIEAYNFRMCFTKDPATRVPFTKPQTYDPHTYELARRFAASIAEERTPVLGDFLGNTQPIPGKLKYDVNNGGPMSTDYICGNVGYVEGDSETREKIWWAHYNYTAGLFWFLSADPALPASLRAEMNTFGLCGDEFQDHFHWPWQLYVREARRMVGDKVFTEHDARARIVGKGEASIGLGGYHFDSHNVQRFTCGNETFHCRAPPHNSEAPYYVLNEGDVQEEIPPFEIPFSVVLPKRNQVSNLVVPTALSSSHVGFCTLRLEPTWMILGHSAGTALALAAAARVNVADVDPVALEQQLLKEHQLTRVGQL